MDTSQTNPFDQFDKPIEVEPQATQVVAKGVNPFDQFDKASTDVRHGATGHWEDESRKPSLSSETATRVPQIPGTEFVAEALTTPLDIIDMGIGAFGLIAKTLEQGGLAIYEHGKAASKGETIDPEAVKNISGFMAEEASKPEYAASLAPIRTAFTEAGSPLPETPVTRVFGGVGEGIEKASQAAGEVIGSEAVVYGGPMVAEGLMALGAAHGYGKTQTKKLVNEVRAEQIKAAKEAGLTTNEMAETILKKAAKEGIDTSAVTKGQIKATLDEIADYYGTAVDKTGKSAKAAADTMTKLNEAVAPFDRRQAPRIEPSIVEPKKYNNIGLVPQVKGVHYSPTQRPVLSGRFYGTGAKGAEAKRLQHAEDSRIKSRVSFYVDEGQGIFPEKGVGKYPHEVPLNNLYDAATNPLKLPAEPNAFESAVVDAGFDGYYVRGAFDRQGAAVLLGDAAKEIKVPTKPAELIKLQKTFPSELDKAELRKLLGDNLELTPAKSVIDALPSGMQKAALQMMEREHRGLRGGLVIGDMDVLQVALAKHQSKLGGLPFEQSLSRVKRAIPPQYKDKIGAFYAEGTGNIYLNTSNLKSPEQAASRLIHEVAHAANNDKLNAEIMARLWGDTAYTEAGAKAELYNRVRARMQYAGERTNPKESTSYFVEEAMKMGQQAGFSKLDSGFWQWATKALPASAVQTLKKWVANIRATMYKYGAEIKESDLTVDDVVALTQANMRDIASGKMETAGSLYTNREAVGEALRKSVEDKKQLSDFTPEKITGLLNKDNWAILTAENPKGKTLTPAENTHRMAALRAELDALGIEHHSAVGVYGGNKEASVVLTNITKEQAREIGDRWDQETVLVKDGLLYSDGSINPAKGIKQLDIAVAEANTKLGVLKGYTHIPETNTTFVVDIDFKTKLPTKPHGVTAREEASFAVQRRLLKEAERKAAATSKEQPGKGGHYPDDVDVDFTAGGGGFKQRGAIGNIYVKTEAEAAYIASQPGVSGWKKTDRGYQVQVPLTLEEAVKLPPEDVINWTPDTIAHADYFKKQRGAVDPKLLITSGIILGGATLGAALSPDMDTTQGLLMGTAIGFGLTRLPQATKAISHNWKAGIKTVAVGTTYATVGAIIDKENPIEGILVGSALFGTRFLPKTKVHAEDDLINARNGNIAAEKRLVAQISKAMKDAVPDKAVREELSTLMENPKFVGRTPQEKLVVDAWRGLAQGYHDIAMNENVKMGFIEGYVSHIIERNALPQSEVNRILSELFGSGKESAGGGRAKFTKERKYPTFESLEKALEGTSLKLKTKDIAEIVQIYSETMTRTIENQKLINNLKEATLGDVEGNNAKLLVTEAQPGYIHLSNPQLLPYFVHPDIAPALKFVFDSRNHGDISNGLIALNRATKRMNVLGSFFHAKSLLEAYALAGGDLFTAKKAIDASLKQFREGGLGDELDLGMRAGLRVELPTEVSQQALVQVGQLADYYVSKLLGTKVGVGEKALGYLEKKQLETFDKFTWDYLHTGLKTATYLRLMEDYKLGKKGQGMSEDVYRQGAASHINDTFGGLDWYRVVTEAKTEAGRKILMGALKPSARDYLGVAIFAPDWTVSTIRAMTKGLPGGSKNPANAMLAREYALRTAVLYAAVITPINYAFSGHFPWDEEQKDPTRIDLGDGTSLQIVKHSMEYAEWVRDPWKTFSNKMGFLPRSFESLRYGKQYPKGPDIEGSRLGYAVAQVAPFTARSFQGDVDPQTSAARALLGMFGISVYGMSEEEKEYAKEQRQLRKEEEEE